MTEGRYRLIGSTASPYASSSDLEGRHKERSVETGSLAEIEQFRQRQISRMVILGATAENKLLLEERATYGYW